MTDLRQKNRNWRCSDKDGTQTYEQAQLAVLMDIRDELQELNRTMNCHNVRRGFLAMNKIRLHIEKRWPRKRA